MTNAEHHTAHDSEYWWKRVHILEYAAMPVHEIPDVITKELGRTRMRILAALMVGNIMPASQIILLTKCKSNRSLKVHLCHIRKELAKHDIELTNVFGVGYWIDPIKRPK